MDPARRGGRQTTMPQRMRILVVATEILLPDVHGGSTHVQELCEHLRAHGPTLLLCRRGSSGEGIAAIGRPMRRYPAAMRHVDAVRNLPTALAVAREFKPDVIYERCTSYGLGAMLSMALHVPLLTMVLDQRYSWLSLLRASRLVATRLDIVPSPVRNKALKVSWGANPSLFDAALDGARVRDELGLGEGFVVGYSGSFKPWHGLETLVGAADRLRHREVKFLLVGDGPRRQAIERDVERRGLHGRFVFTGSVPYADVPRLLAAADVCAAPFTPDAHGPSRKHGFTLDPLKVFEYLALGKPTITIRAPNIEALFADGEHLLLVEPGDDRDLADAIARFMDDPDLAARTAVAGRDRVLERHTWAAHADQLATVFRAMMEERRAA
jgi:glycosyltransferase involved in cell wall biosynthesis